MLTNLLTYFILSMNMISLILSEIVISTKILYSEDKSLTYLQKLFTCIGSFHCCIRRPINQCKLVKYEFSKIP